MDQVLWGPIFLLPAIMVGKFLAACFDSEHLAISKGSEFYVTKISAKCEIEK